MEDRWEWEWEWKGRHNENVLKTEKISFYDILRYFDSNYNVIGVVYVRKFWKLLVAFDTLHVAVRWGLCVLSAGRQNIFKNWIKLFKDMFILNSKFSAFVMLQCE